MASLSNPRHPALRPAAPSDASRSGLRLEPGACPIADYCLERPLGQGGFGEVWRARGPGGFDVALKFIRLGGRAAAAELRALEVMKRVRHPHLLPMFGAWERDDHLIVAMELADGTLLDHLNACVTRGLPGVPRDELLAQMRAAAHGIDYLNGEKVVHRDIKPQNLLLVGGSVKVADFGLARIVRHTITATGQGGMTPAYAAPEFLNKRISRWSDQYSLAVTYCQLRGAALPFGGNAAQVAVGHLMHPPDLSMLPEPERPAVLRALAKKPAERWPNCIALVDALVAAGPNQVPFEPETPTVAPTAPTPPSRERVTVVELRPRGRARTTTLIPVARRATPREPEAAPEPRRGPVRFLWLAALWLGLAASAILLGAELRSGLRAEDATGLILGLLAASLGWAGAGQILGRALGLPLGWLAVLASAAAGYAAGAAVGLQTGTLAVPLLHLTAGGLFLGACLAVAYAGACRTRFPHAWIGVLQGVVVGVSSLVLLSGTGEVRLPEQEWARAVCGSLVQLGLAGLIVLLHAAVAGLIGLIADGTIGLLAGPRIGLGELVKGTLLGLVAAFAAREWAQVCECVLLAGLLGGILGFSVERTRGRGGVASGVLTVAGLLVALLIAAALFWPGSENPIGDWKMGPTFVVLVLGLLGSIGGLLLPWGRACA